MWIASNLEKSNFTVISPHLPDNNSFGSFLLAPSAGNRWSTGPASSIDWRICSKNCATLILQFNSGVFEYSSRRRPDLLLCSKKHQATAYNKKSVAGENMASLRKASFSFSSNVPWNGEVRARQARILEQAHYVKRIVPVPLTYISYPSRICNELFGWSIRLWHCFLFSTK